MENKWEEGRFCAILHPPKLQTSEDISHRNTFCHLLFWCTCPLPPTHKDWSLIRIKQPQTWRAIISFQSNQPLRIIWESITYNLWTMLTWRDFNTHAMVLGRLSPMIYTNISSSPIRSSREWLRIRLCAIFSAPPGTGNHTSKELGVSNAQPSHSQVEPKGHQGHLCRGNELLQTKLCSYSLPKGKNLNPNHLGQQRKACSPAPPPPEPFWSYR